MSSSSNKYGECGIFLNTQAGWRRKQGLSQVFLEQGVFSTTLEAL
jgi:hypothetical protein